MWVNPMTKTNDSSVGAGALPVRNARPGAFGRFLMLALVPAAISLSGCGESRVEVFPVTGKLTFDGKPPAGAQITLHPVSAGVEGVAPSGAVKPDGSFQVSAYQAGDGAPPGDYVATVQWFKFDEKLGGAGPNVIPAKYTDPKTSPIKVTIKAGGPTEVEPIVIASKS